MAMKNNQAPKTIVDQIAAALVGSGVKLFHDQYNEPYIAYNGNGSNVSKVHSNIAKLWLVHYGHTQLGKVPSTDAVNRALEIRRHVPTLTVSTALEIRTSTIKRAWGTTLAVML